MSYKDAYALLKNLTSKPDVWSAYTAETLWADKHISRKMLDFHLDPGSEPASRPHAFIDRSTEWIASFFNFASGVSVLDLGCGPGLYASRFCSAGAKVRGMDFSENSLNYARTRAREADQEIEYVLGDYLKAEFEGPYDLVTMIYCDFCALSPEQRALLLNKIKGVLKPGGRVLFDVFSLAAYDAREEGNEIQPDMMGGFWSDGDYVGIRRSWKYEEEKVFLDKYDLFEADRQRTVYNWLQYYSRDSLEAELSSEGFRITEWYADVAGTPFEENSPTMAVVIEAAP